METSQATCVETEEMQVYTPEALIESIKQGLAENNGWQVEVIQVSDPALKGGGKKNMLVLHLQVRVGG